MGPRVPNWTTLLKAAKSVGDGVNIGDRMVYT